MFWELAGESEQVGWVVRQWEQIDHQAQIWDIDSGLGY